MSGVLDSGVDIQGVSQGLPRLPARGVGTVVTSAKALRQLRGLPLEVTRDFAPWPSS